MALPAGRLGEGELLLLAGERVPPVRDPIGPRDEALPAGASAHLGAGVTLEHVDAVDDVAAERRAHFGDHDPLIAQPELELLSRRCMARGHGALLSI